MLINENMEMQNKENKITYTFLNQTTISILEYFPGFIHYTELSLFFFLFFFNMTEIIVYYKSLVNTLIINSLDSNCNSAFKSYWPPRTL